MVLFDEKGRDILINLQSTSKTTDKSDQFNDDMIYAALCLIKQLYIDNRISKTVYLNCVKDGLSRCKHDIGFNIEIKDKT